MDEKGRENFWNLLCNTHNNSLESVNALKSAAPYPEILCRYRSVNEKTLKQLQDNTLWFSSADYYDDPFDTYFYVNAGEFKNIYDCIRPIFDADNISLDSIVNTILDLYNTTPNFQEMERLLKDMGDVVRRKLFTICFCESSLNETLWIKYANNYHGFVLIYDFNQRETILCGMGAKCKNCITAYTEMPYIYPVYYSDTRYNASKFALISFLINIAYSKKMSLSENAIKTLSTQTMWEAERITLIKKKCHENDEEWRMIRPMIYEQRTFIKARPKKIILGLRMPEYERRLVISAAKIAGVQEIHEMYINNYDELDSKPISDDFYHI